MGEAPEGAAEAPGAWRREAAQGGGGWGAWRDARRCHSRRDEAGRGRAGPRHAGGQGELEGGWEGMGRWGRHQRVRRRR